MPEPIVVKLAERGSTPREYSQLLPEGCSYILMPETERYAKGLHNLQEACKGENNCPHPFSVSKSGKRIYRALSVLELMRARITDFNTLYDSNGDLRSTEDRLRFFDEYLDSCTGIAYRAETTKFKIIPVCRELVTLRKEMNAPFLPLFPVDYGNIARPQLDSSKGKYNKPLPQHEVVEHKGWLSALEEDKHVLREYAGIVFSQLKAKGCPELGMAFNIQRESTEDELRSLFLGNLAIASGISGYDDLNNGSSFLRLQAKENRNW